MSQSVVEVAETVIEKNIQNKQDKVAKKPYRFSSMVELLQHRAKHQADHKAYGFFSNAGEETQTLTYEQLHRHSVVLAHRLSQHSQKGDRALLLFSPGLEFMVAYFGCLYAGVLPVPVIPSRRGKTRHATVSIMQNATPAVALANTELLQPLKDEFSDNTVAHNIQWLDVSIEETLALIDFQPLSLSTEDTAFLQYTSGSTSSPKGVMVTHGNLLENSEMIKQALGNDETCHYVSWVPLYHDMGLIYNVLQSLYLGSSCVLMAPVTFLQRPLLWLKAISQFKAKVAGGPNFSFDLCVERFNEKMMEGIDLSHWEVALNGAEPVRADTIRRFSQKFSSYGFKETAFYPCYGMAEATLLISGGERKLAPVITPFSKTGLHNKKAVTPANKNDSQLLVGCGKSLIGERVAIVDPETLVECPPCRIGEIWAQGGNIASGYWENAEATRQTFKESIAGQNSGAFLRTGDLGFVDSQGELYIAGRLKDIIIVRGENFYPQDIEKTAESSHPALKANSSAAFSMEVNGQQQLVLVLEVKRAHRKSLDVDDVLGCIRKEVVREHELTIHKILLIKTETIPKTSSGKIQRALTRVRMQEQDFEVWGES